MNVKHILTDITAQMLHTHSPMGGVHHGMSKALPLSVLSTLPPRHLSHQHLKSRIRSFVAWLTGADVVHWMRQPHTKDEYSRSQQVNQEVDSQGCNQDEHGRDTQGVKMTTYQEAEQAVLWAVSHHMSVFVTGHR